MVSASSVAAVIVIAVLVVLIVWIGSLSIKTVRHAEIMIIERFGRYQRTLKPGIHFIVPIADKPRTLHWRYLDARAEQVQVVSVTTDRIDMREHVIDFGRQHVITKDTVQIEIDALVYFRITDPRLAVYKIQNLPDAVELLTQSTLRNIIAQMTLDDTFSSREQINQNLLQLIQRDAERWGVTITRVEIFNIVPPDDIKDVMEKQIKAERDRRSTVLQADGDRESVVIRSRGNAASMILHAEGRRSADLLRAKGEAEAKILLAKAEAQSVTCLQDVVKEGDNAVEYLVALQYLNALKQMSVKKDTRVVLLPVETVNGIDELLHLNPIAAR